MNLFDRIAFGVTAGAVLLFSAPVVVGQDTGFYLKADLGGNVTQDIDLKEYFGVDVSGKKVALDPGIRGGISGGYKVTDWFAAEAELGFMINEIKSVTGATGIDDATFSNVPFLVNARFEYPIPNCPLRPYIGAGVGFSEAIFDIDYLSLGGVSISGSDYATVFAWQAFAGLRYAINERMGLSVEYRYFEADSPSWEADFTAGTYSNDFSLGRIRTHAVSLAFEVRF